jgi:hypothetical protein
VREEDDVLRQLTHQQRLLHGAVVGREHGERLVAHLPAVAVRTVQKIAAPPLACSGDVGELVADARRDQDAACRQHVASAQPNREAGLDRDDLVLDDLDAVVPDFISSGGEQLLRRHPVAEQEAVHV